MDGETLEDDVETPETRFVVPVRHGRRWEEMEYGGRKAGTEVVSTQDPVEGRCT